MPRYFFNIHKDHHTPDSTGADLADLEQARVQAARVMAQEMTDHPGDFWNDEEWHIEVTDQRGLILFAVYSAAIHAAATMR